MLSTHSTVTFNNTEQTEWEQDSHTSQHKNIIFTSSRMYLYHSGMWPKNEHTALNLKQSPSLPLSLPTPSLVSVVISAHTRTRTQLDREQCVSVRWHLTKQSLSLAVPSNHHRLSTCAWQHKGKKHLKCFRLHVMMWIHQVMHESIKNTSKNTYQSTLISKYATKMNQKSFCHLEKLTSVLWVTVKSWQRQESVCSIIYSETVPDLQTYSVWKLCLCFFWISAVADASCCMFPPWVFLQEGCEWASRE